MEMVACTEQYWEFVRKLRTDPRVLDSFVDHSEITPEMQVTYMTKHSDDYRICLIDGEPVGFVGAVDNDLRVCTHPDHHKKGIGLFMMKEIIRLYPQLISKVKVKNHASRQLMLAAGMVEEFVVFTLPQNKK